MKIALVSDSESGVNIFPLLRERLSQEIADVKLEEAFVPTKLDIPHKVLELTQTSDLIFVFCLYSEKDFQVQILLDKLVEIEIKTGTKILKAVEQSEIEELADVEEIEAETQALAEKWASFILNYLYNPEKFIPKIEKEEEFSEF